MLTNETVFDCFGNDFNLLITLVLRCKVVDPRLFLVDKYLTKASHYCSETLPTTLLNNSHEPIFVLLGLVNCDLLKGSYKYTEKNNCHQFELLIYSYI